MAFTFKKYPLLVSPHTTGNLAQTLNLSLIPRSMMDYLTYGNYFDGLWQYTSLPKHLCDFIAGYNTTLTVPILTVPIKLGDITHDLAINKIKNFLNSSQPGLFTENSLKKFEASFGQYYGWYPSMRVGCTHVFQPSADGNPLFLPCIIMPDNKSSFLEIIIDKICSSLSLSISPKLNQISPETKLALMAYLLLFLLRYSLYHKSSTSLIPNAQYHITINAPHIAPTICACCLEKTTIKAKKIFSDYRISSEFFLCLLQLSNNIMVALPHSGFSSLKNEIVIRICTRCWIRYGMFFNPNLWHTEFSNSTPNTFSYYSLV